MRAAPSRSPSAPPTSAACAPSPARWRRPTTNRASGSASRWPMPETLLVELLTEELPPKSLRQLAEAFKDRLHAELTKAQLAKSPAKALATPRRLAVLIPEVLDKGQDRETEVVG